MEMRILSHPNLGYLPRFYASYGDFENIEFSPLILSYINNGYCDPDDIRAYISKDYGLLTQELVALSHLGHYSQQSESQVRKDIGTLLDSIKEKRLPYSELVNAAKALSGVEDELIDESYKKTVMDAINDKTYPERDEYFSDMKPENVSARESFSYQMNELLKSQKDDYDRQKEKEEILQLFQLASSDKNYIVKDSRLKGNKLFEKICDYNLVRELRTLNDKGLYRIAEANINDIASSQSPLSQITINALTEIRDELIRETKEDGGRNNKTNRFRTNLATRIDEMLRQPQA